MPLGRLIIDLAAVVANWRRMAALASPAETAAVVKADAYGLGVAAIAPALAEAGCRTFFVASLAEGVAVRRLLPDATVAVLSDRVEAQVPVFREERLAPVLNHPGALEAWRREGGSQPAWLHIDTGMNRLGFSPGEWRQLLAEAPDWRRLGIFGLMSHYACADEPDHPLNAAQRDMAVAAAKASGLPLSLGNSPGICLGRDFCGDLVRPGMALYGLNPMPYAENPMQPVVTLEVQVLQVRDVTEPGTVGYGAGASVDSGQVLATVALGYADGLHRALSNRGQVYFDGEPAAITGRVSMDSVVADVTHLRQKPRPGDWAEVIGPHQSADTVADRAGTIGYEILTSLGRRYDRSYLPAHRAAKDC